MSWTGVGRNDTITQGPLSCSTTVSQLGGTPIPSPTSSFGASIIQLVSTASAAATLPPSTAGTVITLLNTNTAPNTISIYPSAAGTGSEQINTQGANSPLNLAQNKAATFVCIVPGQWWTFPQVPS